MEIALGILTRVDFNALFVIAVSDPIEHSLMLSSSLF
jgi:hypothetical protein